MRTRRVFLRGDRHQGGGEFGNRGKGVERKTRFDREETTVVVGRVHRLVYLERSRLIGRDKVMMTTQRTTNWTRRTQAPGGIDREEIYRTIRRDLITHELDCLM